MTEQDPAERLQTALTAFAAISKPHLQADDFFLQCTEVLAQAYGSDYAFIGLFEDQSKKSHIKTMAAFHKGQHVENFVYPLYGSPCHDVLCVNQVFVSDGLAARYPEDPMLEDLGLESYFGSALLSPEGEPIGLVVVVDTQPMETDEWLKPLLGLFADRISHELERQKTSETLRLSASVFHGRHDGILIMNPDWTILQMNRVGENITGWAEKDLKGQHVFALKSNRETIEFHRDATRLFHQVGHWQGELWLKRVDDKILPVDCTVTIVKCPEKDIVSHYVMTIVDISEKKYAEERIHRLAYYDAITDLPNRTHFMERVHQTIADCRKNQTQFSLMVLDLDGFKSINDQFGHAIGDKLLSLVGKRLQSLPSDTYFSARLGGDEFAILYIGGEALGEIRDAMSFAASEIVDILALPYDLEGHSAFVTGSLGIACYPDDGKDANTLVRNADFATYDAKNLGRNRYAYFRNELREKASSDAALQTLLRSAIEKDQFHMIYQPRYGRNGKRMTGAEALIRWTLDDNVAISPAQFIPIAEETGLILPIGKWVIETVFKQAVLWKSEGHQFGHLSINISGRQMLDPDFIPMLSAIIINTDVDPRWIELEITETWLMEDPTGAVEILKILKDMGFSLSIDDFGVAYSSMNYLRHFSVDTIKIDQSFIRDIDREDNNLAIVSAIIAMGHSLGLTVLAEGIETREQFKVLRASGCDEYQGFYFAKPMNSDAFIQNASEPKRKILRA